MTVTVNYKRLRFENIQKTIEAETESVNKIITRLERGAVFYALGGLLYYEEQSQELGEKFAVEALGSMENASGGGFWYEPYAFKSDKLRAGCYAYFNQTAKKAVIDNTFLMDEYDYHNKNWYMEILNGITRPYQVVWTKPYVDDTGSYSLMTTVGAGVFKDDKLIAITTVDWQIEAIVKKLKNINLTKNSFVLLCVPEKDYIITGMFTENFTGDSLKDLKWDITSDKFTYNDKIYLRFEKYMDNGWLLSIQIPEDEIFSDMEKHNRFFLIIIAVSFAAIIFLAYLLISMFINNPIKNLTNDVAQIELGNLDTKIDIKSNDELGQLARTFNKMTSDLKKSIEENIRDREEKKRISTELSIAHEIQANMLPGTFPPFPERNEFDIFAEMIPAKEVGGDFYDFFFIDNDNLAVVIADVSGKGIPASLFMVNIKTLINYISAGKSPKKVFELVNKKLCKNNDSCIFVTAIMGIYNIRKGKFTFVNAGHNPPLLKKKNGSFEYIKTKPHIFLAIKKDAQYLEEEIYLEEGDTLYLYTDGVTEAMNSEKELFGEERLLNALNKYKYLSVKDLLNNIKKEVDAFAGGAEQADDIAMLALHANEKKTGKREKTLTVEAKNENLEEVTAFLAAQLKKINFPSKVKTEIEIAVEEIFNNIAQYAYNQEYGIINIAISVKNEVMIKFEDYGQPFNPLEHEPPDFTKPIKDREIGGLGLHLVKNLMSRVEYTRQDGKNILIMTKNIG
jgi:sigma-B regulation protein RsbU (phosphoserine phosphatase)